MKKEDIYSLMNNNPVFFLATAEGEIPHVRGMLLYRADSEGIIFHTGTMKQLYKQILNNPNAELCFFDPKTGMQLRVSGKLEILKDKALIDEITEHPSRGFLKAWKESGELEDFYNAFIVCSLKGGKAKVWTMETNLDSAHEICLD